MTGNVLIYYKADDDDEWTLLYTADNCSNFNVNKNSGVMNFSLPIVDTTKDTTDRAIKEKSDIIRISGIDSDLRFNFDADVADIQTLLDLASNSIEGVNKLYIESWDLNFIGAFSSVNISQSGGDGIVSVSLSMILGDNIMN